MGLQTAEFALHDDAGFGGDEVAEGIGGVVAAEAFVVGVEFEDIGGLVGVVLEGGEAINEAAAALVDEEGGFNAGGGIPEAAEEFGPAEDAAGVGGAEAEAEIAEVGGDAAAIGFGAEAVRAGDELQETAAGKPGGVGVRGGRVRVGRRVVAGDDTVAGEHFFAGEDMALGDPAAFGVFIDDDEVVLGVAAGEEDDGVMGVAEVHGRAPIVAESVIEMGEDMSLGAEGFKELAGGDVPAAVIPGIFLPTGSAGEEGFIFGVEEGVVVDGGIDEAGLGFAVELEGDEEEGVVPAMADAAGVGGGVDAGPPVSR